MTTTNPAAPRAARRLPMSPAAGAALAVTAVVLGALGAGTLLLHGTTTAGTLVTLSGALFGMGLVLAIFRKVGLGGPRITWTTFFLAIAVLVVFAAGPFLLSQYAPGNDPAAVAMGLAIAALTMWAGVTAARREATARRSAWSELDAGAAAARGSGPDADVRREGAGERNDAGYSAEAALADVASSRAALADAAVTPVWYHPLLALALAVLILALGLDIPGAWLLAIEVPVIALMVGVLVAYRRTSGMWFSQPDRGTRAWRLWVALMVLSAGCLALTAVARFTGLWGMAVVAAVVVFVGYVALGRAYDDAFRAELRADATARDAVRSAER